MTAVEDGERHVFALPRLQMHVPVCRKQSLKAEVFDVEGRRPADVVGHDDGIIAGRFHSFPFLHTSDTFCLYVNIGR
ncbi:hypothetical protein D3C87_1958480 [compost metagenome]